MKAIKKTIVPGLDIITANTNLAASEIELAKVIKESLFYQIFYLRLEGYDYILIDCPPALGF